MDALAYKTRETDVLEKQPDSTVTILNRLDGWRNAADMLWNHAQNAYAVQARISEAHATAKRHMDTILPLDSAGVDADAAVAAAGGPNPGPQRPVGDLRGAGTQTSMVRGVVEALRQMNAQSDVLARESEQAAQTLSGDVLPAVEALREEIQHQYDLLDAEGYTNHADVHRARKATEKYVVALDESVPLVGSARVDPLCDPYVLRIGAEQAVARQIAIENKQAEYLRTFQQSYESFEQRVIAAFQEAVRLLSRATGQYHEAHLETNAGILQQFDALDAREEWRRFREYNAAVFVPEEHYQRSLTSVVVPHFNSPTTKPIFEGVLHRKGALRTQARPCYCVVTPAGYLHQYESVEESRSGLPQHSLYIPESKLSKLSDSPKATAFSVSVRSSQHRLAPWRKTTYVAPSRAELVSWHEILSGLREPAANAEYVEVEDDEVDAAGAADVDVVYVAPVSPTPPSGAHSTPHPEVVTEEYVRPVGAGASPVSPLSMASYGQANAPALSLPAAQLAPAPPTHVGGRELNDVLNSGSQVS